MSALDYSKLDAGIRKIVAILLENGIETYESCEGGPGHSCPEPTVRFYGSYEAGWRALGLCNAYAVRVGSLRWAWQIIDGHPTGPNWEMTFLAPHLQPELIDFTNNQEPRAGEHRYMSTACLHGHHGACRKTCKFCEVSCRCRCHQAPHADTTS
jgi:hypothetical protein